MSMLFSPVQLGPIEVRNRAWVSPMCQYSCEEQDGMPGDWHREHLTSFARGGAGLVMTEAAAIEPIGRISPQDLGIWNDAQAEALAPIAARIRAHGAVAAVQLAHAGRKASTYREWSGRGSVPLEQGGWPTVSAGSDAFGSYAAPRALAADEVAAMPWLLPGAKSLSYSINMAAKRHAVQHGFDDVVFVAPSGRLLEGPTSTLVIDRGGKLLTPSQDGILASITLEHLMRDAPDAGLEVAFAALEPADLLGADGAWLLSSGRLLAAVTSVDGEPLPRSPLDGELRRILDV